MRTYAVTGSASGVGKATAELLAQRGQRVIGIDIRDAEVVADLSTREGVVGMARAVEGVLSGAPLDGVISCAGLALFTTQTVRVNYYGAIRTMELLRPLQRESSAPRTVVIASMGAIFEHDAELVRLLLDGTEDEALAKAAELESGDGGPLLYATSKRALVRWIRRVAPGPDWAAAGIPLNAVAPGVIDTPMIAPRIASEKDRAALLKAWPMPLGGIAQPIDVAHLLAWLASEENTRLCGQVVFIDGGTDAVLRGDDVL